MRIVWMLNGKRSMTWSMKSMSLGWL